MKDLRKGSCGESRQQNMFFAAHANIKLFKTQHACLLGL
jgi:hypothetical protein